LLGGRNWVSEKKFGRKWGLRWGVLQQRLSGVQQGKKGVPSNGGDIQCTRRRKSPPSEGTDQGKEQRKA